MSTPLRITVAAAFIGLFAMAGINVLPRGGDISGTAVDPSPSAAPSPTATTSAAPYADATSLAAGTYFIDPKEHDESPARWTFTVPDGWEALYVILWKDRGGPGEVAFGPWTVPNVYADPCHWQTSLLDPPIGPTVEDLATALMNQVGRDASVPTDVMLGGYPAKRIEMSIPADLDVATCDEGKFLVWGSQGEGLDLAAGDPPPRLRGRRDVVYIVDVEGVRWVIDAWHMPAASEEDLAELEGILASIVMEPATPAPSAEASAQVAELGPVLTWSKLALDPSSLQVPVGETVFPRDITRVVWLGDRFVFVDQGAMAVSTSTDGLRWEAQGPGGPDWGYYDQLTLMNSFATWQGDVAGWDFEGPAPGVVRILRSPEGTVVTSPFEGSVGAVGIGPVGIVARVHSALDFDAFVTTQLGPGWVEHMESFSFEDG